MILIQKGKLIAEVIVSDDESSLVAIKADPFDKSRPQVTNGYGSQIYTTNEPIISIAAYDEATIHVLKQGLIPGIVRVGNGWRILNAQPVQ